MSIPDFRGTSVLPGDVQEEEPQSMTKSAFESLGIDLDNGKPKFRLNEPVLSGACSLRSQHFNHEEDDEETSFVVLGKSSMDFVNSASLAVYEQIKKQSLAIDTSIVSTLSHEEIEKAVVELLQENQKLKDTLSQNNNTMKHHFNTLVSYQEELKKVHENHKQKFAETRDMITLLKNENEQLKTRLTMDASMMSSKFSGEMIDEFISQSHQRKIECPSLFPESSLSLEEVADSITAEPSALSRISVLAQNAQSRRNESSLSKTTIEKSPQPSMDYQQEIINALKKQIKILSENSFAPLQLNVDSDNSDGKHSKQFLDNFTHYNKKLGALAKCYTEQMSRFTEIQECLKSCIETLDYYENFEPSELSFDTRLKHKQTLDNVRRELIEEQLKNISERQNLIKAQKQFESIFLDYNAALHELDILREENSKPVERNVTQEPGNLNLLKEKKMMEEAKERFELEKKSFLAEKTIFELEIESLSREKASLNTQSMLYEAQMQTLQENCKALEKRHNDLVSKVMRLKEAIEEKDIEQNRLRAQLEVAKDDQDQIEHLRAQMESYKLDFEEERISRQDLLKERDTLTTSLATIREYNQQLLQKINGPNPASVHSPNEPDMSVDGIPFDAFCISCGLYKMPGQWHGPGLCQPFDEL
ncbi:filamin A-interacting protein 1-like [Fopius arisanus]|uniref:Filamin A-interacting protein 1-like n=1 Tax=Fopius arisanus TaxID=64838 RepID=A0A0C9RC38_9HYME|nr:PREDICTED: filamin A-interacting protein 1-like [Fopius arisanus]XP_011313773.1 PREDICTED: filamin A-interacting protein 1-like [Fopius arisanus]